MVLLDKWKAVKADILQTVLESEVQVDLIFLAIACRLNMGMFGPPGNAKTLSFDEICKRIESSMKKFYMAGHSHVKPEELIGAFKIDKLNQGILERNGENFIQDKDVYLSMFDEAARMKTVKSVLLPYLNERIVKIGNQVLQCNVFASVLAANSEFTETDDQAFNNRIAFRCMISEFQADDSYLAYAKSWKNRKTRRASSVVTTTLSLEDIKQTQEEVIAVEMTDETITMWLKIIKALKEKKIYISNRMADWYLHAIRAVAWFEGRTKTIPEDCVIGNYMLWESSETMEIVQQTVNSLCNGAMDEWRKKYENAILIDFTPSDSIEKVNSTIRQINDVVEQWKIAEKCVTPRNRPQFERMMRNIMTHQANLIARKNA